MQRGDAHTADKRDTFAVVEYASAVNLDPKYGEARWKLAQAHERLGNVRAAFPEYIRAADALPDDRAAQIKATQILLLAGQFENAKARITRLLDKDPKDVEALLMQANALAALRDPEGALAQIEEALRVQPNSSEALVNLGAVRMQTRQATEAEAAFRRAVDVDSKGVDSRLALANFLWATNRVPEAEEVLKEALARQPQHLLGNRMLASLYLATNRPKEAEQPLKVVADTAKVPAARFQLADYYANVGRAKDATDILTALSADPRTYVDAESRLAALEYVAGRKPDAHKRLDAMLTRLPNNPLLLQLKAQWLTDENKLDEALERAKAAVAAEPLSAAAHFTLAVIHDRRREGAEAANQYTEVLRLNPRVTAAQTQLSRLSLTSGDAANAVKYAEEARQADPSNLNARAALVRSLVGSGNLTRAETEVADMLRVAPNVALVNSLKGTVEASRGNVAAAQKSFERALQLTPGLAEALAGVTYLDLVAKDPARAIARLEPEIAKQPNSAMLLGLLARVQSAAGDPAKAEQSLRRAVTVDPRFTDGYAMLGQLYLEQGRLEQARVEFEGIAQRNPSAAGAGAQTMVAWILQSQGKQDEAAKAYQVAVAGVTPSPLAANNLAFIYAEKGENLDVALQLATTAKQGLPDNPSVDDTLGWVYYKKGLPSLAVEPLEASLRKRPDRAAVLYHLGLTYAKLGEQTKARDALTRALKLDPKVGGDEARRALTAVSQ